MTRMTMTTTRPDRRSRTRNGSTETGERRARCSVSRPWGGRVSVNERRGRDEVRCALESVPIDYSCNQQID